MWGVIEAENIHVVPVAETGEALPPHVLDELCVCGPHIIAESGKLIAIHQDEQ